MALIVAVLSIAKGVGQFTTNSPSCPRTLTYPSWTCAAWLAHRYSASNVLLATVVCCLDKNKMVPMPSSTIWNAEVDLIAARVASDGFPEKLASQKTLMESRSIVDLRLKVKPSFFIYLIYLSICCAAATLVESHLVTCAHKVLHANLADTNVHFIIHVTSETDTALTLQSVGLWMLT